MQFLALVSAFLVVSAQSQTSSTTTPGVYEPCNVCNPGLVPTNFDAELSLGVSTYIPGVKTCRDAQHLGNIGGIPPAECVLLRFQSPHPCGCTDESLVPPTVPTAPIAPPSMVTTPAPSDGATSSPTTAPPSTTLPTSEPTDDPTTSPTTAPPTFTPTVRPTLIPIRDDIVITRMPTITSVPTPLSDEPSGEVDTPTAVTEEPILMLVPSAAPVAVQSPTMTTAPSSEAADSEAPTTMTPTESLPSTLTPSSDAVDPELEPSDTEGSGADEDSGEDDDDGGEILNLRRELFFGIVAGGALTILLCLMLVCSRVCCATAPVSPSNDMTVVAPPPKEDSEDVEQPPPPPRRHGVTKSRGGGMVVHQAPIASELAIAAARASPHVPVTDGSTASSLSSLRPDMMSRKINAPPGKLGLTIDTTLEGARIQAVSPQSPLFGHIFKGDMILSINNVDTRAIAGAALSSLIVKTFGMSRELVVISEDVIAPEKTEPTDAERAKAQTNADDAPDAPTMPTINSRLGPDAMAAPDPPPPGRKLIMLCTSIVLNRSVKSQQERAKTALNAHKIPYDTLDGVSFPELRDELWAVSPLERGIYPQFFWVDLKTGKPTFWGDFEVFSLANDNGRLVEEFGGGAS